MKLPKVNKQIADRLPLLCSFALPFLGMVVLMAASGYVPFGNHAMLYSDMWHQYYPFFVNFRKMLLSGESLLFNWDLGLGLNYLGLMAYYLASPLNLLCIFLPASWSLGFFMLLPPLKMGFAGLFFGLFLKKVFGRNDLSVPLFSAFYALCAWAMGYQWNLMWLDSFALLPLIMLGMVQLLQQRKFILYTAALFLAVSINYYIGFFLCIFVVLAFLCYEISYFPGIKGFFKDTVCILFFSLLAAMLCAVVLLPTLDSLQATASAEIAFPQDFSLNITPAGTYNDAIDAWNAYKAGPNIGLWFTALWKSLPPVFEGMKQVLFHQNGGLAPTMVSGLPNIFCGVLTNLLAVLYLFNRRIRLREKLCAVFLLVFFNLSFVVRQLDFIWHGFHFPNSIPYRFSFLYSFVLVFMAYRAWEKRKLFRPWQIICALLLSCSLVTGSEVFHNFVAGLKQGTLKPSDWIYPLYNLLLVGAYGLIFLLTQCHWKKPRGQSARSSFAFRRRFGTCALLVVMLLEVALNLLNFNVNVYRTYRGAAYNVDDYPKKASTVSSMLRIMEDREKDNPFYRVEMTRTQTLNDSAINGYAGLSLFSSSANASVTRFMQAMGFSARENWNQYVYKYGSPVTHLFLNLKYLIQRQYTPVDSLYFEQLHHYNDVYLLENTTYLPLGFMVRSELSEVILPEGQVDHFVFQNQFLQSATGIQEPVWSRWRGQDLAITGNGATLSDDNAATAFTRYQAGATGGTVTYTFTAWQDGEFCLDLHLGNGVTFNVYRIKNGNEYGDWLFYEGYKLTEMVHCGAVSQGDRIQVVIPVGANEASSMIVRGAILNDRVYRQAYELFSRDTLEITHFENTCVKGTITATEDGLLYTSIPQDGHWAVYMDGEKAESKLVGGAMVAVSLEAGNHTLEFRYENPALTRGLVITLAGAAIFAFLCFMKYGYPKIKNNKKRAAE